MNKSGPAEPGEGHRPGTSGYRRLNVAMLMAGVAGFGMLYSTQPLLPRISQAFGVDASSAALTVSAGTGGLALAVWAATAAAIRWGRIRVMRVSLVMAVVCQLAASCAPRFGQVIALRLVLGIALAGVIGVAMGHVGAEVHPSGLGAAMGLYVAGNTIGGVVGRLVASAAGDVGSWRVADLAVGAVGAVATAVFLLVLPPGVHASPVAGIDRLGGRLGLWLRPPVLALVVMPFLLMGGFVAIYNYLTYRLEQPPFSLPSSVVGLVFLAYLAGTAASAVAGRSADLVGRPRAMAVALVVTVVGLVMTLPHELWLVVAGLVVFTAGFFAAHAVARGWLPLVATGIGPQASGAYVTSYYAGSSVLGAAIGVVWTQAGWAGTALVVIGLTALAAVCAGVAAIGRVGP